MRRGLTGEFVPIVHEGREGQAFVPKPLPPEPPLKFTPDLRKQMELAVHALGGLDNITTLLPEPDIFLYTYVRREAVLSSQIEGTRSTLSDLMLFELEEAPGVPFDDVREVSNYVRALDHGMRRLQEGMPICNRLLREMHAILLDSGRGNDKRPGQFRHSQNWIGGLGVDDAGFVPPPPGEVETCMADLERFINAPDAEQPYETLVKAALAHVQFETIHPFLDGNGRMGRMLVSFILHAEGLLRHPLLYLSLYLRQHRQQYFDLLMQVRLQGDWEAWLSFFLVGVREVAGNAVGTAQQLIRLFQADETKVSKAGKQAGTLHRVLRALQHRPVATIAWICRQTGISHPAVGKAMDTLQGMKIVREITGKHRGKVYAYAGYLGILEAGIDGFERDRS